MQNPLFLMFLIVLFVLLFYVKAIVPGAYIAKKPGKVILSVSRIVYVFDLFLYMIVLHFLVTITLFILRNNFEVVPDNINAAISFTYPAGVIVLLARIALGKSYIFDTYRFAVFKNGRQLFHFREINDLFLGQLYWYRDDDPTFPIFQDNMELRYRMCIRYGHDKQFSLTPMNKCDGDYFDLLREIGDATDLFVYPGIRTLSFFHRNLKGNY